jgi:hypothetical protein
VHVHVHVQVLEAYPESEAAALGLPDKAAALPPSAASSRLGRRLEAEAKGGRGGGLGGDRGGGRGGRRGRGSGRGGGGKGGGGKGGGGGGKGGGGRGGRGGGGRGGGEGPPSWAARAARGGAKRSFLLFDQTLINAALLSAVLGKPAWPQHAEDELHPCSASSSSSSSFTTTSTASSSTESGCLPKDVAWAATRWLTSAAAATPASLAHPPWPSGLGQRRGPARRPGATLYGDEAAVRFVELRDARPCLTLAPDAPRRCAALPAERVAKAPAWLFSAESDVNPLVGRTSATMWGATPPPAAIVHFVCSSWPGSDGRRAAMQLWGRWHMRAPRLAAALGGAHRATQAARGAALLGFAGPLDASSPAELLPWMRLLVLLARRTRLTPVLPLMRCAAALAPAAPGRRLGRARATRGRNFAGVAEAARRVLHAATGKGGGDARPPGWLASPEVPRPCGWVVHRVGGTPLSPPLCVQRPTEGCFSALALPTDLSPRLDAPYWRALSGANASSRQGAAASAARAAGVPVHPLGLAGPAGGGGRGGERTSEGSSDGAVARLLALADRLAEVEANGLLWRKRQESRGVPQATRVTLLSFEPADARVVLALDELRNAGSFERLFRAQAGQIR